MSIVPLDPSERRVVPRRTTAQGWVVEPFRIGRLPSRDPEAYSREYLEAGQSFIRSAMNVRVWRDPLERTAWEFMRRALGDGDAEMLDSLAKYVPERERQSMVSVGYFRTPRNPDSTVVALNHLYEALIDTCATFDPNSENPTQMSLFAVIEEVMPREARCFEEAYFG